MRVNDQHPTPGTQHEAKPCPPPDQLRTETRETSERAHGLFESLSRVLGQAVGPNQPIQVGCGSPRDLDPRHALQVVESHCPTSPGILESLPGSLQRAWQAIQQGSHVPRIGVCLVQSLRKQRSCERAFIDVRSFGQPGQLGRIRWIERDVETPTCIGHLRIIHGSARFVHVAQSLCVALHHFVGRAT
jgi:hypothetical protein